MTKVALAGIAAMMALLGLAACPPVLAQQRPVQWQIGEVDSIKLYVIQTQSKCFYITRGPNNRHGLFVGPNIGGCQ